MGIPSYYSYIIKKHRQIITKINNTIAYHNLYFDSNSIIYDSIGNVEFIDKSQYENDIIKKVCEKLEKLIIDIKPTKRVFIAFDGVAPVAKLKQQKNRRYKTAFTKQLFNEKVTWDSLAITPGTDFMNKLTINVNHFFNNKFNNIQIIISGPDNPGEGEHKIFSYIRKASSHKDENTVIYGNLTLG